MPTMDDIINAVCATTGVSRAEYDSPSRLRRIVMARFMAWSMATVIFDVSGRDLARKVGIDAGRVLYGLAIYEYRTSRLPALRQAYAHAWELAWTNARRRREEGMAA